METLKSAPQKNIFHYALKKSGFAPSKASLEMGEGLAYFDSKPTGVSGGSVNSDESNDKPVTVSGTKLSPQSSESTLGTGRYLQSLPSYP
jgi:hypothetical protein